MTQAVLLSMPLVVLSLLVVIFSHGAAQRELRQERMSRARFDAYRCLMLLGLWVATIGLTFGLAPTLFLDNPSGVHLFGPLVWGGVMVALLLYVSNRHADDHKETLRATEQLAHVAKALRTQRRRGARKQQRNRET